MKKPIVLLALGFLGVLSADVTAQTAIHSFGDLSETVRPGMTVVVDLADGSRRSGKVLSLSGDRIEIRRRRWNWRAEQLTFAAGAVRRIEHRDSTWNGELLGVGAGVLAAWVRCKTGGPDSGVDVGCLGWSLFAPIGGGIVGHIVDHNHRRPVYVAPGVVAVSATIRFLSAGCAGTDITVIAGSDRTQPPQAGHVETLAPFLPKRAQTPRRQDDGWDVVYKPLE